MGYFGRSYLGDNHELANDARVSPVLAGDLGGLPPVSIYAAGCDVLRDQGTPAAELGLLDPAVSDDHMLAAMVEHPILVNRPIVVTTKGTKLCRPSEVVLELLENVPEQFTKEDGEVVRP